MPKRIVVIRPYEVDSERATLKPSLFRKLRLAAVQRAPECLQEWVEAESELQRFYAAPRAALSAFYLGDIETAAHIAQQALALAPQFPDNWNAGNALHYGHTVLGLVAHAKGQRKAAVTALHLAGAGPGSPQLNSYGPSMLLARELLLVGERQAVLDYLNLCANFWKSGAVWLRVWRQKILRGGVPHFGAHLYR